MRRPEQKIHMVTGKGGVGKTAVAASLALKQARLGRKVLLVELGDKSFFRHIFPEFNGRTTSLITQNLWVARWEPEAILREYFLHYLKVDRIVGLFFDNPVTKSLVGAAPGLRELALLGKLTSGIRGVGPDLPFDDLVLDAYATGHFKALLRAPVGMAEAVRFGPMGEQSRSITAVIQDASVTQIVVVSLPEELPTQEAQELCVFLHEEFQIAPLVILNKNLALPISDKDGEILRAKLSSLSPAPQGLIGFLDYLQVQGRRQEKFGGELRSLALPLIELPLYLDNHWPEILRHMGSDLERLWPR